MEKKPEDKWEWDEPTILTVGILLFIALVVITTILSWIFPDGIGHPYTPHGPLECVYPSDCGY